MLTFRVNAPDSLHVRALPWVDSELIATLPFNAFVSGQDWTVHNSADGYDWRLLMQGWVADEYLTPYTTPTAKSAQDLWGVNLVGPGAFQNFENANVHPAVAVVINQPDRVAWLRAKYGNRVFIVARSTNIPRGIPNASYQAGLNFFRTYFPLLPGGADVYSFCNEWIPFADPAGVRAAVAAYQGLMDAANTAGVQVTVGDFAVGNPRIDMDPLLAPMLDQAAAQGHILNYHWYSQEGSLDITLNANGLGLRVLPWLRARPTLKCIFGEFGLNVPSYPGIQPILTANEQAANLISIAGIGDQVLGLAGFADSAIVDDWRNFNFRNDYGSIAAWQQK